MLANVFSHSPIYIILFNSRIIQQIGFCIMFKVQAGKVAMCCIFKDHTKQVTLLCLLHSHIINKQNIKQIKGFDFNI